MALTEMAGKGSDESVLLLYRYGSSGGDYANSAFCFGTEPAASCLWLLLLLALSEVAIPPTRAAEQDACICFISFRSRLCCSGLSAVGEGQDRQINVPPSSALCGCEQRGGGPCENRLLLTALADLALKQKRMEEVMAFWDGVSDKHLGARSSSSGCSSSCGVPSLNPRWGTASTGVACPAKPKATVFWMCLLCSPGPS